MQNHKRFIIFGMGRTGSSLLADLLNAHPQVRCEGELFHTERARLRLITRLLQRYPLCYLSYRQARMHLFSDKTVYGFKLHTKLNKPQLEDMGRFLHSAVQQEWQIIHLTRQSLFSQSISGLVAGQTGRYFGQDNQPEPLLQMEVAVDKFMIALEKTSAIRQTHQQLLRNLPHLTLTYEDDLAEQAHWPQTLARCCAYVGIAAVEAAHSRVTKPWQRSYAELISNYAELQAGYAAYVAHNGLDWPACS